MPSLGTREVLAFGEGVALPARLKFGELNEDRIPRSEAVSSGDRKRAGDDFIEVAIERWRRSTMSHKRAVIVEADHAEADPQHGKEPGTRLSPERYRLLKKPADGQPDFASSASQRSPK